VETQVHETQVHGTWVRTWVPGFCAGAWHLGFVDRAELATTGDGSLQTALM